MWSANATNNFFILQKHHYMFRSPTGHHQLITIVMTFNTCCFSKILILLQYIHYIQDYEAYLLLLNLYLYNIEEVLNIQLFT
jgi:hypothetical protein